jgi:hypothetical protein
MSNFFVALAIEGKTVESSAIFVGDYKKCKACVKRLNRLPKRDSVSYLITPCGGGKNA